jgi:hypothetical protein
MEEKAMTASSAPKLSSRTDRRRFVPIAAAAVLGAACQLAPLPAAAASDHDCPRSNAASHTDCGFHNMMLVGTNSAYLSHLPFFHSEHRFQVIVEATFDRGGESVQRLYTEDREAHPEIRMYTVAPSDEFVLARVFAQEPGLQRTAFLGTVFRGHLERGGEEIEGLQDVNVNAVRVIYGRELLPDDQKPDELRYILFGEEEELFLAHQITRPPDFDQIVSVDVSGLDFTAEELRSGMIVRIPGRDNTGATRLRVSDSVEAVIDRAGSGDPITLHLDVQAEPYFEDGELQTNPTFARTPLEIEAGF